MQQNKNHIEASGGGQLLVTTTRVAGKRVEVRVVDRLRNWQFRHKLHILGINRQPYKEVLF